MSKNKKLLTEFDFGFDDGGGFGGGGGGGGDLDDMFSTFIQPFTDVVQTAVAAGLEVGNQALGLFTTILGGVLSTILPFLDAEYEKIDQATQQRTQQIQSKFKDVFDRTEGTLNNKHFQTLLFLTNPGAAIASAAGKYATKAKSKVEKLAKAASESPTEAWEFAKKTHGDMQNVLTLKFLESSIYDGNLLIEKTLNREADQLAKDINDSKLAKKFKQEALSIVKDRLNSYYDMLKQAEQIENIESLQKLLKFDNKLIKQYNSVSSEDDKQEIEIQIIDDAFEQLKNGVLGTIEAEKESFLNSGIDVKDIVQLYDTTINTIKRI